MFDQADERRLRFIRRARNLGFSLDEIRQLLALMARPDPCCAPAQQLGARHLDAVRRKIADLRAMETVLAELLGDCHGSTEPCPLIDSLSDPATGPAAEKTCGHWDSLS